MSNVKHTVNYVFPNWMTTGGIFTLLSAVEGGYELPWTADANLLDLDYHGNRSGDKLVSPLVEKLIDNDGDNVSVIHKSQLALLIYQRFIENWTKRWEALQTEYNPLENYSMTETESRDGSNTGTVAHAETHSETSSVDTDSSSDASTYAYDSSTATPTDRQESSAGTESSSSGSRSDTRTDNLAHEEERELSRSGNIGVTTSQQMLESELEIRKYDFYVSVFEDIDKVLTIPVY